MSKKITNENIFLDLFKEVVVALFLQKTLLHNNPDTDPESKVDEFTRKGAH